MALRTRFFPTFARRFVPALILAVGLMLAPLSQHAAQVVANDSDNVRYAAMVVDAESGEVLFARHADSPRYPASITKVMTLYMVFEALNEGRIGLEDQIVISPRAASQPPSKLGLPAGQTISVDDAIRALAVRSANDIAVALAEHVAGSEARFASMSTLRAQELGMTGSRFVNPHGLPDSRQISTARDIVVLSRAIMRDFPQYYHYFGQQHWLFNGREYANTNGLLHSRTGYDGIKTGFTNASGYNLAASSVRDGRRIITVVLGGRSTQTRNSHVAELTQTGFELQRRRGLGEPIQVAQAFFEQRGYGIPTPSAPVTYASATPMTPPQPSAPASTATREPAREVATATFASAPAPRDYTASLNTGRPVEQGSNERAEVRTAPASASGERGWQVQVGAFRDETVARNWLGEIGRRFRDQFREAEGRVQSASGWYRARYTGFTRDAAEAACAAMRERNVSCLVLRPD